MKRALIFSLTSLAAAVIATPASAGEVLNKLAFSVAGTYTEASGNGLHFADLRTLNAGGGRYWRPLFIEPDHEWDYALGLSYRLGGNNTRVFFSYDHFKDDEDREVAGNQIAAWDQAVTPTDIANVNTSVVHKERTFKIGLRHTLCFGPKFDAVVGTGVDYTKVQRTFNTQVRDLTNVDNYAQEVFDESEGFGPFFEATGRAYPWGGANRDWSFWARAGLALLYVDHTGYNRIQDSTNNPIVPYSDHSYFPEDTKSILTKVEADMGVEWNRVMRADFSDLSLGVKLGVRYHNITNAFKNGNLFQAPSSRGLDNDHNTSPDDYGRMGPFVEFRIGGADA